MEKSKSGDYTELQPTYASSIMHIFLGGSAVQFTNIITYDYIDLLGNPDFKSYFDYVQDETRFVNEINLFWGNLQYFIDHEINKIKGNSVNLDIVSCNLDFREKFHPYVQWIIKFKGETVQGVNVYENEIEVDVLDYPIASTYIFESPLEIDSVDSQLENNIDHHNQIVEFYGEKGDKVGPYEAIKFRMK